MLRLSRWLAHLAEFAFTLPVRVARLVLSPLLLRPRLGSGVLVTRIFRILKLVLLAPFSPRLGHIRFAIAPVFLYVLFAVALTYIYAPIRGLSGQVWMGKALRYANERSLGTAIYDARGSFVGMFDPILDSEEDFNYTGRTIELPGYIAYPDHKSLHVGEAPEDYWRCLVYQEDRHLGSLLNPFGIDLVGVLKIPLSTLQATFGAGGPRTGAGGSTIPMQLARVFVKRPPSHKEDIGDKLRRKATEWWLAPVLYVELTKGGNPEPLKLWAANHFPLAQRTGGQPLYGVEQTAMILFGKRAAHLSTAEQYVLAAAVNRPVILLTGSDRLNERRLSSWRYVAGERARNCAEALLQQDASKAQVLAELDRLAASPPDPQLEPEVAKLLAGLAPSSAEPAGANPIRRSNTLIQEVKYGLREELKHSFGFDWRSEVRGVQLTLDVAHNLRFRDKVLEALTKMQRRFGARMNAKYSLQPRGADTTAQMPDIVIAAADRNGEIVRYFESNYTAAYYGSSRARDAQSGLYDPAREARFIASTAKIAAAIAVANEGQDTPGTGYVDVRAPSIGLEACGKGEERRMRRADVAFACSLNAPLEWRVGRIAPPKLNRLAGTLGLTSPPNGPPIGKSLVIGQVAASPRSVQRMASLVLAALNGSEGPVPLPSLVKRFEGPPEAHRDRGAISSALIKPEGRPLLRTLLSGPLCYRHGTLRRLNDWCAGKRPGVKLHFAKTGTRGTGTLDEEAFDTVDLWVTGGISFESGAAYSYVVLVGTGNPSEPWARDLYAGAVAEPLVRALLEDLAGEAKTAQVKSPPRQ